MKTPFKLKVVQYLIRIYFERWSFERNPKRHQERMWLKLQKHVLSRSPKYNSPEFQDLTSFPIQEKKEFMGDFNSINTQELDFNEAMEIAVKAENSRDFTPTIKGLTVGLSSGTSGNRGLFVVSENERAKFWLNVLTELQNRGVKDILIACIDGLKGFPDAINTVYPETQIQLCIVHMVRNSLKFVPRKDYKAITSDLKQIYQSATEEDALVSLSQFEQRWDSKYPNISRSWRNNWQNVSMLFNYPEDIRKAIYTTNAIESLNSVIRKTIKKRKLFPHDDSAKKVIYLAI